MGVIQGEGGWLSARDGETQISIRVALNDDDDVVITDVLVSAPEVTTDTLRRAHPSRLLAAVRGDVAAFLAASAEPADQDDTTIAKLRSRAVSTIKPAKRKPLGRPDGGDEFYRRMAAAYRSAASESGKPAVVLAEENEVPIETVRRWVKEARRRGHLASGRRGRAL